MPQPFMGTTAGAVREDGVTAVHGQIVRSPLPMRAKAGFTYRLPRISPEPMTASDMGRGDYALDNTQPELQTAYADQVVTDSLRVHSLDGTAQLITVAITGRHNGGVNALFDANFYLVMNVDGAAAGADA